MAAGIARPLDVGGRLCIPRPALRAVHLSPGDLVEIFVGRDDDDRPAVFLRKYRVKCHICESPLVEGEWVGFKERPVCFSCLKNLKGVDVGE